MGLLKPAGFLYVLIFWLCFHATAQPGEQGLPFIDYFHPKDYKAGSWNFNVIRDTLGIYYFSNVDGVLTYNGIDWELIRIKENYPVYWMEMGKDGTIYVGSNGEIGYLDHVGNGELEYVSLMDEIRPEHKEFGSVWEVEDSPLGVVFRSRKYIYLWNGQVMKSFAPSDRGWDVAFNVRDTIFTRNRGVGMGYLDESGFQLLPNGEYFADIKINIFLPYEDKILIGSRYDGLFLYDNGEIEVFKTEADNFLKKYKIYHGCTTPQGHFAFAAYTKGVAVIDKEGKIVHWLDETKGLIDYQYLYVRMFDPANIWIANGVGTSVVQMNSPLSYYDHSTGLYDVVTDVIRYDGQIYATTLRNEFKLELDKKGNRFEAINDLDISEAYQLDSLDGSLLISCQQGLITFKDSRYENIIPGSFYFAKVSKSRDQILVGTDEVGFGVYYNLYDQPKFSKLDGYNRPVKAVLEIDDQYILLSRYGHLTRVSKNVTEMGLSLAVEEEIYYKSLNGVDMTNTSLVVTLDGYFNIRLNGDFFEMQELPLSHRPTKIQAVERASNDRIWICYEDVDRNNYCDLLKVDYGDLESLDLSINSGSFINNIWCDQDGVSWFAGDGGLLRFDPKIPTHYSKDAFACHIGKMMVNEDSVIFRNNVFPTDIGLKENSGVRFQVFTNDITTREGTVYQYQLEGLDKDWSSWTSESHKEFTTLRPGTYTFQVRAKNAANQISSTASVSFEIMTPWYKSKLFVMFIAVGLIILIAFWNRARVENLKLAKVRLEKVVQERTHEIEMQKAELEHEVSTKDRLFSIIGHDLRSPLNSIQSLSEMIVQMQALNQHESVGEMITHLDGSVKGVRHLIDNLLAWGLNKSGKLELSPEMINVESIIAETIQIYRQVAIEKEIVIKTEIGGICELWADKNCISTVLRNIISNAIKFSDKGSEILIESSCDTQEAVIKITDNGIGISEEKIKDIFEISHTTYGTANEKGSGLGLVLVKEFVELGGGEISVESEEGKGTTFTVSFPVSKPIQSP